MFRLEKIDWKKGVLYHVTKSVVTPMSQQILSLDTICNRKQDERGDDRGQWNNQHAALENVFVRFTRLQNDNLDDEDDVHFFQITFSSFILRIS